MDIENRNGKFRRQRCSIANIYRTSAFRIEFEELFSPFSIGKLVRGKSSDNLASNDRETGLIVVSY